MMRIKRTISMSEGRGLSPRPTAGGGGDVKEERSELNSGQGRGKGLRAEGKGDRRGGSGRREGA